MPFPGDCVRRFNPQILDLNRSGHWPLTSRPDGAGERTFAFVVKRLMVTGWWIVELFWVLQKLTKGLAALSICRTSSHLVPTTPSNQETSLTPHPHSPGLFHVSPLLPVDCRNHIVICLGVVVCGELLDWSQSVSENKSPWRFTEVQI